MRAIRLRLSVLSATSIAPVSLLAVTLLLSSACESETGILIETSAREGFREPIESLRFFIGKNEVSDRRYYADTDPLDDVAMSDRDLTSEPHRLLLSPGASSADEDAFVVAVLAMGSDGPIGFGRLASPIQFPYNL